MAGSASADCVTVLRSVEVVVVGSEISCEVTSSSVTCSGAVSAVGGSCEVNSCFKFEFVAVVAS